MAELRQRNSVSTAADPSGPSASKPQPPPSPTKGHPDKPIKRDPKIAAVFLLCWFAWASYITSVKPRMGLSLVFSVVFFLLHQVVQPVTVSLWPGYNNLSQVKKYSWNNLTVALLHASFESVMCLLILVVNWNDFASNFNWLRPSLSVTPLPLIAVSLSLGYCAIDTWDMIQSGEARTAFYLIIHHAMILLTFTIGLYYDLGLWYLVLDLLCEINTVFLHIRVLLRHMGFRRPDAIYRSAWRLLFLSMYVARLPVHAVLCVRVFLDRYWWPNDTLWYTGLFAMIGFNVLNIDLNRNLSKAYRRERQTDTSKRVKAIAFLADWLWPLVGIGSVLVYGYLVRDNFPAKPL